ncbi:alcohol dehydrogenase catalytic domain-containing protein [Prauserella oleivorans]
MYAATVTRTDGPAALEVVETPAPVPSAGEVLIDVKAAGVNFPDLLLTKNMYQYKPELPFVLGGELAGVVVEAPSGSGFSPVIGWRPAAPPAPSPSGSRYRRRPSSRFPTRWTSPRAHACR